MRQRTLDPSMRREAAFGRRAADPFGRRASTPGPDVSGGRSESGSGSGPEDPQAWYARPEVDVLSALAVDPEQGLDGEEAARRRASVGPNALKAAGGVDPAAIFLGQFRDFMVLVLLAATFISGLLGEFVDAVAILTILLLNAFLGFVQEYRAERALEALGKMAAPKAEVVRDGRRAVVPAEDVVPGDVVVLKAGDRVPADVRLLWTEGLLVDEAPLTGESVPVEKRAPAVLPAPRPLGDRTNMAFMGTLILKGRATGVAVATGMATEMGKIADLIALTEETDTPLKRRIRHLGRVLVWIAVALTAAVTGLGVLDGYPFEEMFLLGVTLAVAAIPEGLPTIVTVVLALGVSRMQKKKALVRRLPAVETLGSTTFIGTDKTGTLTLNRMTLVQGRTAGGAFFVSGSGYRPEGGFFLDPERTAPFDPEERPEVMALLTYGVLASEARLLPPETGDRTEGPKRPAGRFRWLGLRRKAREAAPSGWRIDGDPTEGAIVVAARKAGLDEEALRRRKRAKVLPFDSVRRRMSIVYEVGGGRGVLAAKGAFEAILDRSAAIFDGGAVRRLGDAERRRWAEEAEAMAAAGLRVLAVAYREGPLERLRGLEDEAELVFVGLVGLIDPPRPDVPAAIRTVQAAHIRVAMITGDHRETARAIAADLGILRPTGRVLTGEDLRRLDGKALSRLAVETDVFARVAPEDKLRIVQALRAAGHIVAMTGDGTNDAPALKAADIGIAMGQSGTEVAKEAADVVLLDDHFATIEAAVEEGRTIYENVRKFVRYLLASNVAEIMVMLVAFALKWPVPLTPLMILWINLVTDGLPALALGLDPMERDVMNRPPISPSESLFARGLGWKILSRGALITGVTLWAFSERLAAGAPLGEAQTVAFATLIVAQLVHVFDARNERSLFDRSPLDNVPLVLSVLVSFALVVLVIAWPPAARIFGAVPLSAEDWLRVIGYSAAPFVLLGLFGRLSSGRPARPEA
ncbi:cation-translocating P-type ATPase [Hydrogenibacillus schlegelii]|nr:cation-translocating P-type ATPase [Hydrogenibacillus schlegelii]